jgi:hypothetical protein
MKTRTQREEGRQEGRGNRQEGRGKREEGRGKREEGRGKREKGIARGKKEEEGRGKRKEGKGTCILFISRTGSMADNILYLEFISEISNAFGNLVKINTFT